MDTTLKSNATVHAITPEQRAHKKKERIDDLTRKISNKVAGVAGVAVPANVPNNHVALVVRGSEGKISVTEKFPKSQTQQLSQPSSKHDHNDIVVVGVDDSVPEFSDEDIDELKKSFSDDGDKNDGMDIDPVEDEDQADADADEGVHDTFMMQIMGLDGCLAMAAQALVGKRYALDTDSTTVKASEMRPVAKMYLFGSNDLSNEDRILIKDCMAKIKSQVSARKFKRFLPFSDKMKSFLKQLDIDEGTNWSDVENAFHELCNKCEAMDDADDDVEEEHYARLFLKACRAVKVCSEKLAEEKAKSKQLMKSFMHEPRSANAVQERKLDDMMHDHVKTYHEQYKIVDDINASTLFGSVLYHSSTLNDKEVEMTVPTELLFDHALKTAPGRAALRAHVAKEHIESKDGSIMQLVRGSRDHGGILSAATHFLSQYPEKKTKLITSLNMSTQLKEDQYYANLESYGDGGKQHLCYTGQLLQVKQNGELGIYIPVVDGKHAPTLVVGADHPVTEEVKKKLKELHHYKQFASSARQAKYVQSAKQLAKAINFSGAYLTDTKETKCVTSFRKWAYQLNECAKEGKSMKEKRDAKPKVRTRDDVEHDSDGATSVISNATTTTNVSNNGSPPRKKRKKEMVDSRVPITNGGVSSEEDDSGSDVE